VCLYVVHCLCLPSDNMMEWIGMDWIDAFSGQQSNTTAASKHKSLSPTGHNNINSPA
jgi:hypothetical protein